MKHVRNFTNGQLTIEDGNGRRFIAVLDEGNLTFEETEDAPVIMSRGAISGFAAPVEMPMPVSFSCHFSEYYSEDRSGSGLDDISMRDALKGNYDNAESITGCTPFTTRLEFYLENPCAPNEGKDETLRFEPFHADKIAFAEGNEANKLTVTGKAAQQKPNSGTPIRN